MEKRRILIVDDNDDIRHTICMTLGDKIYHLRTAANPLEAIEILESEEKIFDLIITDMAMPMMSGIELVRHIKSDPELANIEIVILSAQNDEQSEKEARMLGVRAVMSKPFGPLQLLRLFDEIFDE